MALRADPYAFRAETVSDALPTLLRLLTQQRERPSRNGTIKELHGLTLTLDYPLRRYVTTPERKVSLPAQIVETMWVLSGRNDVKGIEAYLPRAKEFSDDGLHWRGGYGPRLRNWGNGTVSEDHQSDPLDQLWHVVDLLRADPDTRRAVVSIYDPLVDTEPGKDIPCNDFLVFRAAPERVLDLHVTIRSNDVIWGWSGINTFEWSVLLELVARLTGMLVGKVRYSVSSFHLYSHHYAKAQRIIDSTVPTAPLPNRGLKFTAFGLHTKPEDLEELLGKWWAVELLIRRAGAPKEELIKRAQEFPDRQLSAWLLVLVGWWHDDMEGVLESYKGTELYTAAVASPRSKKLHGRRSLVALDAAPKRLQVDGFAEEVAQLHKEKDAAYGDSWKRRGEMLGIMANLARKVDRLGANGGGDTATDTAVDLLVYLVKYRLWLYDHGLGPRPEPTMPPAGSYENDIPEAERVRTLLLRLGDAVAGGLTWDGIADAEDQIRSIFEELEKSVVDKDIDRWVPVGRLTSRAHWLALTLTAHDRWKAANATRPFTGYATTEDAE